MSPRSVTVLRSIPYGHPKSMNFSFPASLLGLANMSFLQGTILGSLANRQYMDVFVTTLPLTVLLGKGESPFCPSSPDTSSQDLREPSITFLEPSASPAVAAVAALPDLCRCPEKIPQLRKSAENHQPLLPSRETLAEWPEPSASTASGSSLQRPLCPAVLKQTIHLLNFV